MARGVPRLRKAGEMADEPTERARVERWHEGLDRSLPPPPPAGTHLCRGARPDPGLSPATRDPRGAAGPAADRRVPARLTVTGPRRPRPTPGRPCRRRRAEG